MSKGGGEGRQSDTFRLPEKNLKTLDPLYSNGLGCGVLSLEGGRVGIGNEG